MLSDAEFWDSTWRELDALATALRGRTRRDDARAARICQSIVGAMSGKCPPLEDFMPIEDTDSQQVTDDLIAAKTMHIAAKFGATLPTGPRTRETNPADDEYRKRMQALLRVKS